VREALLAEGKGIKKKAKAAAKKASRSKSAN